MGGLWAEGRPKNVSRAGQAEVVRQYYEHSRLVQEAWPLYLIISPANLILKVPFLGLAKEQTLVVFLADFPKCVYNRMSC